MKIKDLFMKKIRDSTSVQQKKNSFSISELNSYFENSGYSVNEKDISEITYFTCIKTLSESMGKLNNKVYRKTDKGIEQVKHSLNNVIGTRPNPYMTATVYNTIMEFNRNHYGNAFAYISRKQSRNGSIYTDGLYPLNPEYTTILIDNIGLLGTKDAVYIRYIEPKSSRIYLYDYEDVLHYRSSIISYDGFSGMAIRDVLHSTLQEKKAAQSITRGIYESGVTGKAVLEYVGELDDNAEAKLLNHIKKYSSGADNYGNIVPIPLGMRLTPLNISLSDVQFLDIKKFTSLEIAAAFGIKPNQLNDYEKSSYSNSEAQNLSFYVDTLLYILNGCEQEDSYKLLSTSERNNGYFIKRNVKGILRADYKSQMESLRVGVTTGIMQINEARNELDLPMVEGGDINIVNGTYIGINDVGKQYKEKGE